MKLGADSVTEAGLGQCLACRHAGAGMLLAYHPQATGQQQQRPGMPVAIERLDGIRFTFCLAPGDNCSSCYTAVQKYETCIQSKLSAPRVIHRGNLDNPVICLGRAPETPIMA